MGGWKGERVEVEGVGMSKKGETVDSLGLSWASLLPPQPLCV